MPKKTYESLGAYIDANECSQNELAERLGITQGALSMIKNGLRVPRPELALKIHALTGVPLEVLLKRRAGAA